VASSNGDIKAYIGIAALIVGAGVPLLVLIPFGWWWLWQNGYALWWLAGALIVSLIAFGVRVWALRRIERTLAEADAQRRGALDVSATLAPREIAAWQAVEEMASKVDPARITDQQALLALGTETVETVARHMNPTAENPLWSFTVPEALTLVERVSQRLRPLVVENVPLGDRLTVGQAMKLYEWRGLIDVYHKAYDIWRIVRLANPIAAATGEIRERLSKTVYEGVRTALAKRLVESFVREVGRAAIDLYSGRLRAATLTDEGAGPAGVEEADTVPIRMLIAGRTGAGKSSLVNALASEVRAAVDILPTTRDFTSYAVQREGMPVVELIDSRGIEAAPDVGAIAAKAAETDVLIWVAAADRPDRENDRQALSGMRQYFRERPERRAPPVLLVLTHIDRLRPFREWSPPYDVAAGDDEKARSIRAAIDAAAQDLDVPVERIVPVCLSAERGLYNVDLVWAELIELLPTAQSAQLLRRIGEARSGIVWRRIMSQAVGAGRLAAGALMRSK
jgi:hypothetical protein